MPAVFLFTTMLIIMLFRTVVPIGAQPAGRLLAVVTLSWRERLRYHRSGIYAIGAALLLGSAGGWLPPGSAVWIVLPALVITFIPLRYIFTDHGVGLNNVVFRPWEELAGFQVSRTAIVLAGKPGRAGLRLTLLPSRHEEVRQVLARFLPDVTMLLGRGPA
ncbi:MAG: hypothetical protein C4289_00850 [Chloroflexota bacterium]